MDATFLAELMCIVPSGTEAQITLCNGKTVKGMARDYPRPGRRWTVDGWEWFISSHSLDDGTIASIEFSPLTVTLVR